METLSIAYMYPGHSKSLQPKQTTHLSKEALLRNTTKLIIIIKERNHPSPKCYSTCRDVKKQIRFAHDRLLLFWVISCIFVRSVFAVALRAAGADVTASGWLCQTGKIPWETLTSQPRPCSGEPTSLIGRREAANRLQNKSTHVGSLHRAMKSRCPGPAPLHRCALPYEQMSGASWEQALQRTKQIVFCSATSKETAERATDILIRRHSQLFPCTGPLTPSSQNWFLQLLEFGPSTFTTEHFRKCGQALPCLNTQ